METQSHIITQVIGSNAIISLNRSGALNALSFEMLQDITTILDSYAKNNSIKRVLITSNHPDVFCAGGDIKQVASMKGDLKWQSRYFETEYALNYKISTYKKPIIALVNGLALGGGVGISTHCTYVILGQNAKMGMPETSIGFFPDVGASYFLNKSPFPVALYMGLAGIQLAPHNLLKFRWATHYAGDLIHELEQQLMQTQTSTLDLLEQYAKQPEPILQIDQDLCETYLNLSNLNDFKNFLTNLFDENWELLISCEPSHRQNHILWLTDLRNNLINKSPTSLCLTFQLLSMNRQLNLKNALKNELNLAIACMQNHDFYEGVNRRLVLRDNNPIWSPAKIQDCTPIYLSTFFREQDLLL